MVIGLIRNRDFGGLRPNGLIYPTIIYNRGFTLIELLVVLFIIGVIITIASLTLGDSRQTKRAQHVAQRLTLVIPLAQEQAILQGTTLGLRVREHGYEFVRFKLNSQTHQGQWIPFKHDRVFEFHALPSTIKMQLSLQRSQLALPLETSEQRPSVLVISSSGEIAPFTLDILAKDQKPLYRVTKGKEGNIHLIRTNHAQIQ